MSEPTISLLARLLSNTHRIDPIKYHSFTIQGSKLDDGEIDSVSKTIALTSLRPSMHQVELVTSKDANTGEVTVYASCVVMSNRELHELIEEAYRMGYNESLPKEL